MILTTSTTSLWQPRFVEPLISEVGSTYSITALKSSSKNCERAEKHMNKIKKEMRNNTRKNSRLSNSQ